MAQPGVAPRQWLPGMRRKQCRSCLTINRCSAPPGKLFTNYWSNSTNDKRARLWRLISKSSRVSSGRNISCRMATRSCFFRLLQGVEMLRIADKTFDSHLFTGTGKFASSQLMVEAIRASGSQLVTLAMKRVDLRQHNDAILEPLIAAGVTLLPNTSGAKTAEEAIFAAHLAREALGTNWLKLEIHPDARWLLPDPIETLKAAETLVQQGFVVLPYCGADPVLCKRLEEVGCAAVMPLGAPIGSNQGLETRAMLEIIIQQATVPLVVDAGIGVPSHAAQALEMGADAVLVNTAIAVADDPVNMAKAFRLAVEAGLLARQSGPGSRSHFAHATSPLTGFLEASA
ncbi:thiazole biosynthesis protein ThiG [Escherichia coli D9]|nr:thiazole biosynthesis protein ThiG [Escherichia coli D9]